MTPTESPPTPAVNRGLGLGAAGCALVGGLLAVAAGPLLALTAIGVLALVGLFAAAAYRPVVATYVYLGALPLIAGINRGNLIPLVRPNEALLVVLLAGALVGGYLRWCRGERVPLQLHRLDIPLGVFLLMSTAWPLLSMTLRGQTPATSDLAAVLPVCKLIAIYLLVRFSVTTEAQLVRCFRLVIWPGAVVAVIAILQTLHVGPVVSMLQTFWTPDSNAAALAERGTATLGSPIATGDYIIICLTLVICCGVRGLLGRRERLALGLVLGAGVLAAGEFSTWIAAVVAAGLILWRFSAVRRSSMRFLWLVPVVLAVGAPALIGRLQGFGDYGVPRSWIGRWNNLSDFYLPKFGFINVLLGVSPNSVLPAPERWREVIYLESGYLELLWIGGIPLLAAFIWLSVAVLRRTSELMSQSLMTRAQSDAPRAAASALWVCWWLVLILTVLDPHLTLRGSGDVLFMLMGITTGRLSVQRR
ncbi:MAG: hypothetical protein JO063_10890 [Pseudonocardiales bacterium]|nr:hypothetical protein [Pseudonocardiales bacterium]MBV9029871.1 hypothetical protein [Pseudonocardiales bacterium]MBW0010605.1 hypothetical protein [Pseudonocardiales bacterium]